MKNKIDIAIILAAGKGKRLDAYDSIKPLVMVAGKPLIIWNIEKLQKAGIKQIFIVVADKIQSNKIRKQLLSYENSLKIKYIIKIKNDMLGSLVSVKDEVSKFKRPFFVTVCDLIFENNPYLLFKEIKSDISMLVSTNKKYNQVAGAQEKVLYKDDKIINLNRNIIDYNGLDVGIYRFTVKGYKDILSIFNRNKEIDFNQVLKKYNKKKKIKIILFNNKPWFDVNTPETLIRAELFLQKIKQPHELTIGKKKIKPQTIKDTINFIHNKKVNIDVIVKKNIINELEKYEIIPLEYINSPHYIIVDKRVDKLYGQIVFNKFLSQGFNIGKIVVDVGEGAKSTEQFIELTEKILVSGIDKNSILISLGGGVINNLTGFLASTLYRGIGLIHIPTTLMSQCDAAIGLKQALNGAKGKNLIGSYYEPLKIVVDPILLLTQDKRYLYDGLAECLKHALGQDKDFYDYFMAYDGLINNIDFLDYVVRNNIKLKINLMENDFKEEHEALVLQYGHEVGHAVEYLSGYDFGHGESISIGMRVSAELAKIVGVADSGIVQAHIDLLKKYKLPTVVPKNMLADDIINVLRYNKKFAEGKVQFALINELGHLWHADGVYTIPTREDLLKKAIIKAYEKK